MRTAFINELIAQARVNPKLFLVVGDVGYNVIEPFAKEFPDRFLNAGVAEQNALGVCAGLAREGYHPWFYSIANFSALRGFEFIRNDIAYHDLPVTIVCVGAGLAYGNLGYSHHAVQDIGVMRTLPNMTILSPADPGEARECTAWLCGHPRPAYLRLGKAGEADLHGVRGIESGPLRVRDDGDRHTAIVATGSVLKVVLEALGWQGYHNDMDAYRVYPLPTVFSCPWLNPIGRLNQSSFALPLTLFDRILVVEEHVAAGGLASLVREHVHPMRFASLSVPEHVLSMVGSQDYLRKQSRLDVAGVLEELAKL